jgi:lysophospholipase L1-like esterase
MIQQLRRRLTYANLTATLALLVALATGGAYAADKITSKDIARNAVRAKHIKQKQIAAKHIKASAVNGAKVRNGSLGRVSSRARSRPSG